MAGQPQNRGAPSDVTSVRLEKIRVENYKAIDELELRFPAPNLPSEIDVFGLGSRNGLGKTSVLEALALCALGAYVESQMLSAEEVREILGVSTDALIRFDARFAELQATFVRENVETEVEVRIQRSETGAVSFSNPGSRHELFEETAAHVDARNHKRHFRSILGANSQPFLLGPFAYFHSYRRLTPPGENGPGQTSPGAPIFDPDPYSFDAFKSAVYELLLAKSDLYEGMDPKEVEEDYAQLEELLEEFAGARLGKLKRENGGRDTMLVEQVDTGKTFPIDGLSSGEKSIVSTLFLVWKMCRERPGLVLIDEPELHMNPEWHRTFMSEVQRIADGNQYVMATHSRDVFSYIDENKRIRLDDEGDVDDDPD